MEGSKLTFDSIKNGRLIKADCLIELRNYPSNSIDLIITDPPYGLDYCGLEWDNEIANLEIWEECRRVLKPGAFIFVMSSARQDVLCKMILNLHNAGFKTEYSSLYWTYNTGFPKARNIGKAIDRKFGEDTDASEPSGSSGKHYKDGYAGFQPKPAIETILVAMKPLTETTYLSQAISNNKGMTFLENTKIPFINGDGNIEKKFMANLIVSDNALDSTPAGALNEIECSDDQGHSYRFSLDSWSEMVLPHLMVAKPSLLEKELGLDDLEYGKITSRDPGQGQFNVPMKNRISDRKNTHPTVKPIKLMAYLVELGSRPGDMILDPFCGTGTTCLASMILGRKFIGIEKDEKNFRIAEAKLKNIKWKMKKKDNNKKKALGNNSTEVSHPPWL